MNEQTRAALLASVASATKQTEKAIARAQARFNEDMAAARAIRKSAIRAAMDAGVPREQIAEAAGVSRARLYQLLDE